MCLPTDDNEARRKTDRKDETVFKFVDYMLPRAANKAKPSAG